MNLSLTQDGHIFDNLPTSSRVSHNATDVLSMLAGLAALEILNYATIALALNSLLGNFSFIGINPATWLATAVCLFDVAGIIILFPPFPEPSYLKNNRHIFFIWLLVTGFNAGLVWLGIAQAIVIRLTQTGSVIDTSALTHTLPIFIVCLIWLVRILIIGSLTCLRRTQAMPVGSNLDPVLDNQSSEPDSAFTFDLLPHGIDTPYGSSLSINPEPAHLLEPTYRGIPVRYKTTSTIR